MAERGRAPGRAQGVAGTWPPHGGVQTRGFSAGFGVWSGALEKLREWVRAEAGAGRLLPWVPIAFGTGIAFYFAADHEPVLLVAIVTALGLGVVAFLLRRAKYFPLAVMAASVAAGFATATFRTAHIAHEVLARPAYSVSLSGFVEARDIRERTDRFVLRVTQIDGPRLPAKLERVRLSVRKGTAPAVGSFVEFKARLQPPLAPLRPGSYDFSRDLFFQGIGASGFVTGSIKARDPPAAGGFSLRYAAFMQDLRDGIDARIPVAADPIYAAIDVHRKAHIAHMAALHLQTRFERRYGISKGSWISTKPCHDEDDAFTAFVAEPATTVQGLLAKLAYFEELAGEFETEWMVYDRPEASVLIQSFAASLKNIGVQS